MFLFSAVHFLYMLNLTATFLLEDCSYIPNMFLCFASQENIYIWAQNDNAEKVEIYRVPW